jgi:hypothetical protein
MNMALGIIAYLMDTSGLSIEPRTWKVSPRRSQCLGVDDPLGDGLLKPGEQLRPGFGVSGEVQAALAEGALLIVWFR